MYRIITGAVSALCVIAASTADAQLVRVGVGPFGGVSVRAPFVAVDTLPFGGGARVRAPFTNVRTRGFAFGPVYPYDYYYRGPVVYPTPPAYPVAPAYPTPAYPGVVQPRPSTSYQAARPAANVGAAEVAQRLHASAARLKSSLSLRRNDADVWLDYLAPDQIIQAVDSGAAPQTLRQLLMNYDGVTSNGSLAAIRASAGFRETHQWLRQYVEGGAAAVAQPSAPSTPAAQEGKSILEPTPAPAPPDEPTPAKPVQAADDEADADENPGADEKTNAKQNPEELPLPTPL